SSSPWGERTERINGIVEKPRPEEAPSTLAVVGRYVLSPLVFRHLTEIQPGAGGELQLTDALARLIRDEPVLAYRFDGVRYDCGSKIGYLQATVELGLRHHEVGSEFEGFLKRLSRDRGATA
ncbi:MAG: sugar phosphate nucleotidyltransferase, partial [Burkholderiaceae bacterium]